ncbi:MAG: DUF4476 domain-containing protein [Cyclobacteriaceae bacterium]|nr:DUF4476 domain-containing protein [Cyclobacteriaceae bacterium]
MKHLLSLLAISLLGWNMALAQIENFALKKRATASSFTEVGGLKFPGGAVDGIKNGGYGFHTQLEDNPWWQVDLGMEIAIDKIVVYNRQDCCSERARTIQVFLSTDGVNFENAYQHNGTIFGGVRDQKPLQVSLQFKKARFVRLQLNQRNALHLDEVEVYGVMAQLANLALGKSASQSSTSAYSHENDAQGGVDGVKNGLFGFHTDSEKDPWWQVDLGGIAKLDKIFVFNRQDCCAERAQTLSVSISPDGVNFQTVSDLSNTVFGGVKDNEPLRIFLNEQEYLARYVRVQLRDVNALHLDEIEVYGKMISQTPPTPVVEPVITTPPVLEPVPPVTLFEHERFGGASLNINGNWDASMNPQWNDRVSSIKVPAGYKIIVYEHTLQTGASMTLTKDWTIANGNFTFNDKISSIKIVETPKPKLSPPAVAVSEITGGTYFIVTSANNKFLDQAVVNGPIILLDADAKESQQWEIAPAGDGYVHILSKLNSLFLDQYVEKGEAVASSGNGQTNQQWLIQSTGNGFYTIVSRANGKALNHDATRSNMPLAPRNGSATQQFKLIPVSGTSQPDVTPSIPTAPVEVVNCSLTDKQFADAKKAIKSQAFRDQKMATAKLALKNKCVSLDQIRGFVELFAFEDQKLDFVKFAYDITDNKDDYYTLHDVFTFLLTKDDFNEFLQSKK